MTPVKKNRKPAPYKEKGSPKTRPVKFVVTEDEMYALEVLSKDWEISIAQSVRTMIRLSTFLSELEPILNNPISKPLVKEYGIDTNELFWRLTTLRRFSKYWNIDEPTVNKE